MEICDGVRLGLRLLRFREAVVVAFALMDPASCSAVSSLVPCVAGAVFVGLLLPQLNVAIRSRHLFLVHVQMTAMASTTVITRIGTYEFMSWR